MEPYPSVGPMVMCSIVQCDVCHKRVPFSEHGCCIVPLLQVEDRGFDADEILWATIDNSHPGLGLVTCGGPGCLRRSEMALALFIAENNLVLLHRWIDVTKPIKWWRESKRWVQEGNFVLTAHGEATSKRNTHMEVYFDMESPNVWTKGEYGTRTVPLSDIVRATPWVRKALHEALQTSTEPDKFAVRQALCEGKK